MTPEHLSSRRRRARVALVAMAVGGAMALGGCAPTPAPDPTPTPLFASEEEAFAAAEATYRAYIDAANRERTGDRTADPQAFLRGEALEANIESRRKFKERGLTIKGDTEVKYVEGQNPPARATDTVTIDVCVGVGESQVLDSNGTDVTPADREPWSLLSVEMMVERNELVIVMSQLTDHTC
ncbi:MULTISPECIES: hypothetical protein [unclassified Microbacterium]|uniref:hypothetical protein n=1 Tax=unclassified Microbacterium TaxID=2609290 RepID=UPI00300FBEC7